MNLKMYIQQLANRAATCSKNERLEKKDAAIYREYFGLGSNRYPTIYSIANAHNISKKHIGQSMRENLAPCIKRQEKTKLKQISDFIASKKITSWKALKDESRANGIILDNVHIRGLLHLFRYAGVKANWRLCTLQMNRAEVINHLTDDDFFIIAADRMRPASRVFNRMKTAPGKHGLADFNQVFPDLGDGFPRNLLEYALLNHPDAWHFRENGHLWYIFANRVNVLMQSLEKMSYVVQSLDVKRAAEILHASLMHRNIKNNRAGVKVLENYLRHSGFVTVKKNTLFLSKDKNRADLHPSDQILIDYFKKHKKKEVNFYDLDEYLEKHESTDTKMIHKCYCSPLMYLDQSGGHGNYTFHFISKFDTRAGKPN